MSVYKRGENWCIDFYANGKRIRETIGKSKTMAQNVLKQREADIAMGKYNMPKSSPLFSDIADDYLQWSKDHKRSFKDDREMLSILKPKFRGKRLADITTREVETVARSLKNERGITGARVNRYLMCLSGLFNQAAKWGEYNAPNPVKNATKYPESPPRTKYLGQEELARLLNAANPDLRDVIVVAVSTGMRQGELFSLRCGDIDFENELIRIPDSKNGERRDVPMSAEVKKILERRRKPLKERLVFCKPDGTKFSNCMRTAWYNALKEAGLEDFRFHDLRHTFASQLMMSGEVGQFDLQELLGHKSLSMTRRYTHLQIASKRKAVSVMDKLLDFHSKEQVADSDGHKLDTSSNQVETKNA